MTFFISDLFDWMILLNSTGISQPRLKNSENPVVSLTQSLLIWYNGEHA